MTEKHQCSEMVWDNMARYHCQRNATYFEKDKWWCAQHAPSRVEARENKAKAKWNATFNSEVERSRRLALYPEMLAMLKEQRERMKKLWLSGSVSEATEWEDELDKLIAKCENPC